MWLTSRESLLWVTINLWICFDRQSSEYHLIVRLGEWDTQTTKEFLPHEDYKVVSIVIHPAFRKASLWNDIALLKLDRKVDFKPHIDSICLPNVQQSFDGTECVTTGWGKNAYSKAENISSLLTIDRIDSRGRKLFQYTQGSEASNSFALSVRKSSSLDAIGASFSVIR